jgi:hypothetical protein
VSSAPSHRNWKGITISLLVIATVIGLVALTVLAITPAEDGARIKGHRLRLADVLADKYKPRQFNGTWAAAGESNSLWNNSVVLQLTLYGKRGMTNEVLLV